MTSHVGLQESSYGREGVVALFDHVIGLLQDKIPTVQVIYGTRVSTVTPFYTASFVKDYNDIPAVAMSIMSNTQSEVGIGQMAAGSTIGEQSGMHNLSVVQLDVWARNRLELEAVTNAVMDTLQKYKRTLSEQGVLDYKLFRTYDRPFDPNAPRMWFGSNQAPGEMWLKMLEYKFRWDYVWVPVDEVYDIKKIEIYGDVDGATVEQELGVIILGLLDSMYLTRHLGRRIKVIRTGGRH